MSGKQRPAQEILSRIFRRLFPGALGDEVCDDLEQEYLKRRAANGSVLAWLWYAGHLLAPSTWALVFKLRRQTHARRASSISSPGSPQSKSLSRREASILSLRGSVLDFKLGFRMLAKYPGLTLAGGLGMAVAITIGAVSFHVAHTLLRTPPSLESVVAIGNWNVAEGRGARSSLRDFETWRKELESVEDVGAFREIESNFITDNGRGEPASIAEISASAFRIMRVPPLMGRPLLEDDGREGAPPVIVIGYDVWRTRFASDTSVVGRSVRLGSTMYTVVGVMPEGFAFPVNHRFWTPLRVRASDYERGQEPWVEVFGRLAPGVSLKHAQPELTTVGMREAAAFPETHEQLRPRIMPFSTHHIGVDDLGAEEVVLPRLFIAMILVVLCANVAILVYARTATRQGEIAVRNALGASRRRIVAQLFVEALVLAAVAAAVALVLTSVALRQGQEMMGAFGELLPYWVDYGISSSTVLYLVGFAVLASVVVGVVPALQATGGRVQSGLSRLGGSNGMQLGKTWTMLIVVQVAVSVAVLPVAAIYSWSAIRSAIARPGFAAEEFLTARLLMDYGAPPGAEAEAYRHDFRARFGAFWSELKRRLEAEPAVSGVTYGWIVPGSFEEGRGFFEVEGVRLPPRSPSGLLVRINQVDVDFFDIFDVPLLAGRRFESGDREPERATLIADRTFVQQVLGGENALGRRVRFLPRNNAEPGPWLEIVGVVADFPTNVNTPREVYGSLHSAVAPMAPVRLALRVGATPATFAGRLREITTALDPTMRLYEVLPLDEAYRSSMGKMVARLLAWTVSLPMLSALFLSTAGIYALSSFAVTQRRREIGIRVALGAHPHRILGSIFSRAALQLAVGVALGVLAAGPLATATSALFPLGEAGVEVAVNVPSVLPAVAALMILVGLAGVVGPARRGLSIQATEALKEV